MHRYRTWVIGTAVSTALGLVGWAILVASLPEARAVVTPIVFCVWLPIVALGAAVPGVVPTRLRSRATGVVAPVTASLVAMVIVLAQALSARPMSRGAASR